MADFRVAWTDAARTDLEELIRFIAADNVDNAVRTLNRIQGRCARLERFPRRGRIVPELKAIDVAVYRELMEKPWRIIYRYDDACVYVLAVLDGRRDLTGLLLERLSR
ncbi:MAG TPA: type II toxin-antitoxin system RelE/ParE family toxin [Gammaproteobacteria bacterium]|nr:type II toxin-antitoxin system RelE/ParE family toxin [Gammaproteobacteria bacterium]